MAARFTATVEGLDRLETNLRAQGVVRRSAAAAAIGKAAALVHEQATMLVTEGPASGVVVTGGGRSKPHQRSAPGEAPAHDFGELRKGILMDVVVSGEEIMGTVVSRESYSAALEFGTRTMEARPFMSRALREKMPEIRKLLRDSQK